MKTSVALAIILALLAVLAFAVWQLGNARAITFPLQPKSSSFHPLPTPSVGFWGN